MSRARKTSAVSEPEKWGPTVDEVVTANYAVCKPYGGGLFSQKRHQLAYGELDALEVISNAANEYPALRALAAWAEANGAPEALLEALESARHGAQWAIEGRPAPENWKPYRGAT